jgi:chromosome segregation protein
MPTPDDGSHGIEDPSRDDSGAPMTTPEPDSPAPHPPRSATLTRIRIAGFKSFSEATNVEVLPGLTGIVGPNGCGKSNVVEALRWAMGESSARSLRGGEMDDIIFAGTASRAGRNMAEVTLTLEDAAGLAPPPNEGVADLEITRRIGRGEGSTFKVNGRELRARDVQTLFADIGSGARSSAMVSQGRVSSLIQARPEDRRQVLEEAAGVSGLRARRHEAELKLRQAEQNLARAEDLLGALDTQRQSLQRQARQANRYRNISGLVRAAEGEWLALLAARAQAALDVARLRHVEARRAVTEAEAESHAATISLHTADLALPAPRQAEAEARTALERRRVEQEGFGREEARARAALAASEARLAQITDDLAQAERAARDAAEALARLAADAATLAAAEAALPAQQEAAGEALILAEDAARSAERAAEVATETAAHAAARHEQLRTALAAAEARARRAEAALARLTEEHDAAIAALVPAATLAESQAALGGGETALTDARRARSIADADLATAETARSAADDAVLMAERDAALANEALADANRRTRRLAEGLATLDAERASAEADCPHPDTLAQADALAEAALLAAEQARAAQDRAELARASAQAAHADARRLLAEGEARRAALGAEAAASGTRARRAAEQHARLCAERAGAEAMRIGHERLEAIREIRIAAEDVEGAARGRLESAEAGRIEASTALASARKALADTEAEAGMLTAEIEGLSRLVGAAGGNEAPILNALTLPPGLEAAVAVALGETLESAASSAAARFWRDLPSLPAAQLPGDATPLAALVEAPALLRRALGSIGLLPDGGDGDGLHAALLPGQSLVTRAGALWRWDGHVVRAGTPSAAAVRLAQRNRIRLAKVSLGEAMARVQDLRTEAAKQLAAEADALVAEREARVARGEAERALGIERAAEAKLLAEAAAVEGRIAALEPQITALAIERDGAEQLHGEAQAALAALPALALAEAEAARRAAAAQASITAEAAAREAQRQASDARDQHRAAAQRLQARAAESQGRLAALLPQQVRLTEDLAAAQAAENAALAVQAALPPLETTRDQAAACIEAATSARTIAVAAEAALSEAEIRLQALREDAARLATRHAEATMREGLLAPQCTAQAAEHAEAVEALSVALAEHAALPDLAQLRNEVEETRRIAADARAEEATRRAALSALTQEGARLQERSAAHALDAENWRGRAIAADLRLAELRQRAATATAEVESLAELPEAAAAQRSAAARLLAEAEALHATAARRLAEAETQLRQGQDARHAADAAFAKAREALLRGESAHEAAEAAASAVTARIAERLGDGAQLPPPPEELSDAAEDRARRKVERLIREREEMGPVNLLADTEMTEAEARIAAIGADREEISTAIAKLRGSIGHLNREGRDRLRVIFDRVDTEFRSLFARLFGGGRAHLALVGSDDPLEAGLEIFAEPPGKKLSALSLLSGGEQALTALSLIFAVFRCNPAPVCVLDEVDAPLDDANVERLCDLLDGMAAESGTRFLIVTHHPLTMARMHRLYGVTMQERGVSRLLSVDLGVAVAMSEA